MNKYYFINNFDTNNIDRQDKQTIIIYRNYSAKLSTKPNFKNKKILYSNSSYQIM